MTGYDGRGARFPLTIVRGADLAFELTVTDSLGAAVNLSAATIAGEIYTTAGAVADTLTAVVSGAGSNIVTLSLTDTETALLTATKYQWTLWVTRGGDKRPWLAGDVYMGDGTTGQTGATTGSQALTVDGDLSVSVDILGIGGDDADVAGYVNDPTSATTTALADLYAPLGSLSRWHDKLRTDPANAKLLLVGDSTSLRQANNHWYLDTFYACNGGMLDGIPAVDGGGNNGQTLAGWYATKGGAAVSTGGIGFPTGDGFNYPATIAADPDLLVLSFGINDVRLGGTTEAAFTALLRTVVESLQGDLPDCDILLRMPNSLVGTPAAYLTPATTAAAQTYSTLLRNAYKALEGEYPNLAVADTQLNVFGTQSYDTSALMNDQLHPNARGVGAVLDYLVEEFIAVPETDGRKIADRRAPATPSLALRAAASPNALYVRYGGCDSGGAGYLDISNGVSNFYASDGGRWAITTSDTIYFDGIETPLSLASASYIAQLTTGVTRIGIAGTYTTYANRRIVVVGAHPGEGVREGRFKAVVDPPSCPANSITTQTVTVTGAIVGQGVICAPGTAIGLGYHARVSAANTVTLTFVNPTAAPVDIGSSDWHFWLAR